MSSGFRYSGSQEYRRDTTGKAVDFQNATGVYLGPNCGIDTAVYKDSWRGVSPICEIVCCDFEEKHVEPVAAPQAVEEKRPAASEAATPKGQLNLFGEAA